MKAIGLTAIVALLGASLLLPSISYAQGAIVEDGRIQLSPKAFGTKTTNFNCQKSPCTQHDTAVKLKIEGFKSEEIKAYLKSVEHYKAIQFMKGYYKDHFRTGF